MTLPTFRTARLRLRGRTRDDLDACLAMDRDPEVVRFVDGPWSDETAHRAFVEARMEAEYPDGLGYWSVFATESGGEFLGWILLLPVDLRGPEIEIGWRFRRAVWGRGYATEAAACVLRHGFATVGLDEVMADIDPENGGSLRVAEKIGLRLVGMPGRHGRPACRYALRRGSFKG